MPVQRFYWKLKFHTYIWRFQKIATKTAKSQLKELVDKGKKQGSAMDISISDIAFGQFEATCKFKATSEGTTIEGCVHFDTNELLLYRTILPVLLWHDNDKF